MYQRPTYSENSHAIVWADYGNNDITGDNSEPLYDVEPDLDAVAYDMWLNDEGSMLLYFERHSSPMEDCD